MSFNGTWSIEQAGGGLAAGDGLVINGSNASGIPKSGSGFWGSDYNDDDGTVTFNGLTHHLEIDENGKLNCNDPGSEGAVWTAQDG